MKAVSLVCAILFAFQVLAGDPDIILHHGKILTVNARFETAQALAVENGKISAVGGNNAVLRLKGPSTRVIDLGGRMVLPGLMDSHSHPASASMTEFDHPIPDMESIADVLKYIRERAQIVPEGDWIEVHQVFITRLAERRYPTRAELDAAAPKHPVLFQTGPDASLSTLALQRSGIDKNFKVNDGGTGFVEKDPATGEPTGILRNCNRFVKAGSTEKKPTAQDRRERLLALFKDYNASGLTAIGDRDASPANIELYESLKARGPLPVRIAISHDVGSIGEVEKIQAKIKAVAQHPLFKSGDDDLRIIGIKTFLDGGMLTGSAYMRDPWGVSKIYGITDPNYRGVRFIDAEKLRAMVQTAAENGLQFTAHSVGDGAVHALLDAYEEVSRTVPNLRETRPCISHSNFMSREAVEQAARLGVALDIQPAWLYHDAPTLRLQFGDKRLRYFQPLRSIFEAGGVAGGGSDHMQKIGAERAINVYGPFRGMQTAITRVAKAGGPPLHLEEGLSREQAIRFYTVQNAKILKLDKVAGSLEKGKAADLIVIDRDLLKVPAKEIAATKVLLTMVGGRTVHAAAPFQQTAGNGGR